MKKFALAITSIALTLLCMTISLMHNKEVKKPLIQDNIGQYKFIDGMPVVPDHPLAVYGSNLDPIEQRDASVRKWLSPSVKISVSGASGSGTIVYYDPKNNLAYVQSCGHLWNGRMTAEEGKTRKLKCRIIIWYQNEKKLPQTKSYEANVLYYYNIRGIDSSLLTFSPDWVPEYFPIAPEDYEITPGTRLHSVGCDGGGEVAHYDVQVVGYQNVRGTNYQDLVTRENSPRPGRSGGGLMSEEGYYVGICWGTSDRSGNGIGLFTPLKTIRQMNKISGYDWLNEVGHNAARRIPIQDRNNPQGKYPKDYIPLPGRN